MGWVGNAPQNNYTSFAKQDLTGATGGTLTLSTAVANEHEIGLYINHVKQEPTTSYTASGTTITLQGYTVAASDDIYVVHLGKALQTVVPPDGSVNSAKLATDIAISGDLTVDTSTLKVNSSSNLVGIGTASPTSALHVSGGAGTNIAIQSSAGTHWRIGDGVGSTNGNLVIYDYSDSRKVFEIDTLGRVTMPSQPCAAISGVADAAGAGSTVTARFTGGAPTVKYNVGSHMDVTTGANGGRFTCPVAGYYLCNGLWYAGGSNTSYMGLNVYKNGGAFGQFWYNNASNYSDDSTMCSIIIKAAASDYLDLIIYGSSADSTPAVFFQVHLLH